METKIWNVSKAGFCLIAVILMILPSVTADICPKLPLPVVVYSTQVSNDLLSDECSGATQTITVHGLVRGVTKTVIFNQNNNQYVYNISTVAPEPDPDSGICGVIECKSHVGYVSSFLFVHTYNPQIPPPYLIMMIYCPLFISESRHNRTKAYIVIPGIDHKDDVGDNTWHQSPWLGGALVWEDAIIPYTFVGNFGWGQGTSEDHIFPFRNRLTVLDEVARGFDPDGTMWIRFQISYSIVSDTGYWYDDQYPYNNDATYPVNK